MVEQSVTLLAQSAPQYVDCDGGTIALWETVDEPSEEPNTVVSTVVKAHFLARRVGGFALIVAEDLVQFVERKPGPNGAKQYVREGENLFPGESAKSLEFNDALPLRFEQGLLHLNNRRVRCGFVAAKQTFAILNAAGL
jgi:hypothetical protein